MRLSFSSQGEGFPIVIIHGLLGSSDNWRSLSRQLSMHYKSIAVDLRNHGRSPHDPLMNYPAMAEDVRQLLDAEQLSKAHLIGHSIGGKVAMELALDYPERVGKLVVVDIAPKAYPPSHRAILTALAAVDLSRFKSIAEIDAALSPQIPETAVRQFIMKNLARNPQSGFSWRINLRALLGSYDELLKPIEAKGVFDKPAYFIRGGRSNYIQDQDMELIRAIFPQARMTTIAKAGHWVHADAPTDFFQLVIEFLQDDGPAAGS
jgi:esterase